MKLDKLPPAELKQMLNKCLHEKSQIGDVLQNDISQILASVLLWIQLTKKQHDLRNDESFIHAEANLRIAIDKVRQMHYTLSRENPE